MLRIIIWTFICVSLFPVAGQAITREAAVEYALKNAESAKIAREEADILRAGGDQAVAFIKPQASLEAAYIEMNTNADKIDIPGSPELSGYLNPPDRDYSAQINLSQMLFAGGRIWDSLNLRDNYYDQASTMVNASFRDIRTKVENAFDNVLYQKAALEILEDRVAQRENELADANDLKSVGVVTLLDVRQAKLSLNFALDALKAGQAVYQEALVNFNTVIGADRNDPHTPEGRLEELPDWQQLIKKLETMLQNEGFLDIKLLRQQMQAAELSYDIARGGYFPEVMLVSSGKSNGEKIDDNVESWNVGVQMRWSLYDGGLTCSKRASALAQLRKIRESIAKLKKALSGTVATIQINGRSLIERTQLQKEAIELSEQNYNDARGHYRAGTITLTRLGEFNLSYAEARFNLLRLYFMQRGLISQSESLLAE